MKSEATATSTPATSPTVSERRGYIGGSDAGVLIGLSPYGTPMRLWAQKTGHDVPDTPDPGREAKFYFGHLLEASIGLAVFERFALDVERAAPFYRSEAYPHMGGHIDFLATGFSGAVPFGHPCFLECKNIERSSGWGDMMPCPLDDDGSHLIPSYYLAQCLHYMVVLDAPFCYIAALIGGCDLRLYRVNRERNAGLIEELIRAEYTFWHEYVMPDEPPEARIVDDLLIRRLIWPEVVDDVPIFAATDELRTLIKTAKSEKQKETKAKNAYGKARDALILKLNGVGRILDGDTQLASVSLSSSVKLDEARFQSEAPIAHSIWEQFRTRNYFFLLKSKKESDDE